MMLIEMRRFDAAALVMMLLIAIIVLPAHSVAKKLIPIGAIFDGRNTDAELAFRHALVRENMYNPRMEFQPMVRYVDPTDSWQAEQTACNLTSDGVVAIFGPGSYATSNIVASVCAALGLPHIVAHPTQHDDLQNPATPTTQQQQAPNTSNRHRRPRRHSHTRNFYPTADALGRALAQIIDDNEWSAFTVLYEHPDSLRRLHDVLQLHSPTDEPITVRQLSADGDDMPLLKAVHASGATRILLDCSAERLLHVLRQAQYVQLLQEYQSYMITAPDAHLVDFASLWPTSGDGLGGASSSGFGVRANVTMVRLMDVHSMDMATAVHDWNRGEAWMVEATRAGAAVGGETLMMAADVLPERFRASYDAEHVTTEAALWHDAVHVFAMAVREFDVGHAEIRVPMNLRCSGAGGGVVWKQGQQILQHMDLKTEHGLTGRIVFDDSDEAERSDRDGGDIGRTDFFVEVLELTTENALRRIATWSPGGGVAYTRTQTEVYEQITHSLQNKTIVVAARLGEPYLRMRVPEPGELLEGNARYEGYSMDLIDEIARWLNFQYRFELVPDNKYGSYDPRTKKWDGLVRQLLDRRADLAICDLTITFDRRRQVDFTSPFMTLGVSILYTKPKKEPPALYQFMKPLSVAVWLAMATAFLCIAIVQFVLGRFAADDWENPDPSDLDPAELETIWDLQNCIWLATGSIMQQGCDLMPKAASTRIVCGLWWFFTLIVIQSYIANLAAVLTKDRIETTIESAEDLEQQTAIKYGAMLGGSTLGFFRESNYSTYHRMWSTMEANADAVLVRSNGEGVERVARGAGSYAFLMESSSIEHIINRNCNLTQVGSQLDSKGYGIALPMNSPYRTHVNQALLKLQEEGKLSELKTRWWSNPEGECPPDVLSSDELDMRRLGGVFVLLAGGIGVGMTIGVGEFLWHTRQVAIQRKIPVSHAIKLELQFILDFRQTCRPSYLSGDGVDSPERSSSEEAGNSAKSYELDEWLAEE